LREGELDYPDDVVKKLELVVASVHNRFGQKGGPLTQRMVNAARHTLTDIVGHPTGRLLLGRAPSEYDVSALLAACAESGCAVELNANPARLDLNERHLAEAKARGVIVSIAADAHSVPALDHIDYGVAIARRAGLTPEDVLNTRTLSELRVWLSARRKRAHGAAA
jgi:DNA polymerase (family 10)